MRWEMDRANRDAQWRVILTGAMFLAVLGLAGWAVVALR